MSKIKVIEENNPTLFESRVNEFLSNNYKLSSSSCGFVQSEKYDFCGSFQAILIKED